MAWFSRLMDFVTRADARLSRYIFSQSHFNVGQGIVKPKAFLPPPDSRLSVFATNRLKEGRVWKIGRCVAEERNQNLHARADLTHTSILQQKLRLVRDEPPRRHRNIVGWPTAEKGDIKLVAMELAAVATLYLPPRL